MSRLFIAIVTTILKNLTSMSFSKMYINLRRRRRLLFSSFVFDRPAAFKL